MTAQDVVIRKQKGFALSPVAQRILAELSDKLGISENAALEVTLRNVAKQEGIQVS